MRGYLSLDLICSSKLTVFLEHRSWKTVRFSEQIMSADKYPSIFSRQMKAIVYVLHTLLRLDACALNYYLFRIGKKVFSACLCGADHETVKHFLIKCPFYAALRFHLLTCAATLFAERWSNISDSTLLNSFLNG